MTIKITLKDRNCEFTGDHMFEVIDGVLIISCIAGVEPEVIAMYNEWENCRKALEADNA